MSDRQGATGRHARGPLRQAGQRLRGALLREPGMNPGRGHARRERDAGRAGRRGGCASPSPVPRCRCLASVADGLRCSGPDVMLGLGPESLQLSPDGRHRGERDHRRAPRGRDPRHLPDRDGGDDHRAPGAVAARPSIGEAVHIGVDPDPEAYPPLRCRQCASGWADHGDGVGLPPVAERRDTRRLARQAGAAGRAERPAPAAGRRRGWPTCCSCRPWCSSASSPSIPSSATSS